jgi:hypothetical protein
MNRSDHLSLAKAWLLSAVAARKRAETAERAAWREIVKYAPPEGPLVIVCAADGAGSAAADSGGGSSKRVDATLADVIASLIDNHDLIPPELQDRILPQAYGAPA